jgi:uncharacterized protein YoxC
MINQIPIYQAERTVAGLAEKIQKLNSVAYLCPIINSAPFPNFAVAQTISELVVGSESDTDLYRTKSILVSTNWNKNDDVFDKFQVWVARNTPSHKPTNIGHDEHQLCGHITNTWAIDSEGKIIADNIDINDLPNLYHIVNGAVIYKIWQDKDLIERTEKLIAEIEDGKKFVSMECIFSDFDYAVSEADDDSGNFNVVARGEETAWITKHLRAYGGTGMYENKRVGRLLKNITFCGKGYVDKPANPNSIIFAKELATALNWDFKVDSEIIEKENVTNLNEGGVYLIETNSEVIMDENEKKQLDEKLQAAENKVVEAEKKVGELAQTNESLVAKIAALEHDIDEKDSKIDELVKSESELKEELNKVRANELKTNRISKLVDGGIEKDVATQKVELFINLSDEQFDAVANELISVAKILKSKSEEPAPVEVEDTEGKCDKDKDKMKDGKAEDDEEEDAAGEQAAEIPVEDLTVEQQSVDLTAASQVEDEEINNLRNELVQAISSIFGVSQKEKKE